jgi:L-threonylcarbamoyladenylate synthase
VNTADSQAISRLYEVKGRSLDKGIPILIADLAALDRLVREIPQSAEALINRYWPGPLTLILLKQPGLPEELSPNEGIAIRMPDNEIARRFIRAAGGAVATSSANRSGQPPAQNARQALEALDGQAAIILDGGPVQHGLASTILDCTTTPPQLLRAGPIPATTLELAIQHGL